MEEVWEKYGVTGDPNPLIIHYLPLVRYLAGKLASKTPRFIQLDDLVSEGTFGLMTALKRFDKTKGTSFKAFARPHITGSMKTYLRKRDWVPYGLRGQATRIKELEEELSGTLGRSPVIEELAEKALVSVKSLRKTQKQLNFKSMDGFYEFTDDEGEITEYPSSEREAYQKAQINEFYANILQKLEKKDLEFIELYYNVGMTLKELGAHMGVSESRASQIRSEIVARLAKVVQA